MSAIQYGMTLPEPYLTEMNEKLAVAQQQMQAIVGRMQQACSNQSSVIVMSARFTIKEAILAIIGGITYVIIELIWRGHSHISMFILGGICFVVIGLINEVFPWDFGLLWQSLIGSVIITACEFITGVIVNIWLGLGVWDYSTLPFNILDKSVYRFHSYGNHFRLSDYSR